MAGRQRTKGTIFTKSRSRSMKGKRCGAECESVPRRRRHGDSLATRGDGKQNAHDARLESSQNRRKPLSRNPLATSHSHIDVSAFYSPRKKAQTNRLDRAGMPWAAPARLAKVTRRHDTCSKATEGHGTDEGVPCQQTPCHDALSEISCGKHSDFLVLPPENDSVAVQPTGEVDVIDLTIDDDEPKCPEIVQDVQQDSIIECFKSEYTPKTEALLNSFNQDEFQFPDPAPIEELLALSAIEAKSNTASSWDGNVSLGARSASGDIDNFTCEVAADARSFRKPRCTQRAVRTARGALSRSKGTLGQLRHPRANAHQRDGGSASLLADFTASKSVQTLLLGENLGLRPSPAHLKCYKCVSTSSQTEYTGVLEDHSLLEYYTPRECATDTFQVRPKHHYLTKVRNDNKCSRDVGNSYSAMQLRNHTNAGSCGRFIPPRPHSSMARLHEVKGNNSLGDVSIIYETSKSQLCSNANQVYQCIDVPVSTNFRSYRNLGRCTNDEIFEMQQCDVSPCIADGQILDGPYGRMNQNVQLSSEPNILVVARVRPEDGGCRGHNHHSVYCIENNEEAVVSPSTSNICFKTLNNEKYHLVRHTSNLNGISYGTLPDISVGHDEGNSARGQSASRIKHEPPPPPPPPPPSPPLLDVDSDAERDLGSRDSGDSILQMAEHLADWSYGEDHSPPPAGAIALAASLRAKRARLSHCDSPSRRSAHTLSPQPVNPCLLTPRGSSPLSVTSEDSYYTARSGFVSGDGAPPARISLLLAPTNASLLNLSMKSEAEEVEEEEGKVARRSPSPATVPLGAGIFGRESPFECVSRHSSGQRPWVFSGGGGRGRGRARGGGASRRGGSAREDDRRLAARVRQAERERRFEERSRQRQRERAEREWRLQLRRGLLPPGAPPPDWLRVGPAVSSDLSARSSDFALWTPLDPDHEYDLTLTAKESGPLGIERVESPHFVSTSCRSPPWMTCLGSSVSPSASIPPSVVTVAEPRRTTPPLLRRRSTQVFFSPWVREGVTVEDEEEAAPALSPADDSKGKGEDKGKEATEEADHSVPKR